MVSGSGGWCGVVWCGVVMAVLEVEVGWGMPNLRSITYFAVCRGRHLAVDHCLPVFLVIVEGVLEGGW